MDLGIISMRYAKALLTFAQELKEDEQVYAETTTLAEAFRLVPGLQQALLNPVLTLEQKEKLLLVAATNGQKPTQALARFVKLVLRKQREEMMLFVAHSYGTLYREQNHIIRGRLVVPTKIDKAVVEKLRKTVETKSASKVDFQVVEAPSILGGFILDYDTYSLDASVRTQLAKLKRELAR